MKPLQLIKTVLYFLAGVAVLVFHEQIMDYIGIAVGIVILFYGLGRIIISIAEKKAFGEDGIFTSLTHILIAVIMFIVNDDTVKVCLVWAVWSIRREGRELADSVQRMVQKKPGIINALESVVIMVLSFTLILNPSRHNAHVHVIILGVELILEVVFPLVNDILDRRLAKKSQTALPETFAAQEAAANMQESVAATYVSEPLSETFAAQEQAENKQ